MRVFLASIGLVVLMDGTAFSQSVTPSINDPFKPGYVNTGRRFGYCANFARVNHCRRAFARAISEQWRGMIRLASRA
jgi:hypothetical protein